MAERPQNFVAFGVPFRDIKQAKRNHPASASNVPYTLSESAFIVGFLPGKG